MQSQERHTSKWSRVFLFKVLTELDHKNQTYFFSVLRNKVWVGETMLFKVTENLERRTKYVEREVIQTDCCLSCIVNSTPRETLSLVAPVEISCTAAWSRQAER